MRLLGVLTFAFTVLSLYFFAENLICVKEFFCICHLEMGFCFHPWVKIIFKKFSWCLPKMIFIR